MRRLLVVPILLAGAAAWRLLPSQRPPTAARPFQPGAYFPPELKLEGAVKLLTPPVVEMGARTRVSIEYTAGDYAIGPGTALEIWKHFTSDAEEFQTNDPAAPAYFSARISAPGVSARPRVFTNWVQRNTPSVFPYRKCAAIEIEQGSLRAGDKVTFDLGGESGFRMQFYEENLFNFRIAITKQGRPVAYAGDALLKVTGGPAARLRVIGPAVVQAGEAFTVEAVPMDAWVSLAKDPRGLAVHLDTPGVSGGRFEWDENLLHYVARDVRVDRPGVARIAVRTQDGKLRGVSNPVWVEEDPLHRVYFGELHQHTYLADGRGVFDELYLYGRRVGLLDFGAVTPHHMPLSVTGPQLNLAKRYPRDNWPELETVTRAFNNWQGFVSLLGYEYSVGTEAGGHHNVFFNADKAKSTMHLNPSDPMAPVGKMIETLKLARVPTLVIPHIGGGPPDWSHPTDPRIERLFEIASVHGVFEESWQKHLATGLRLGVIGAGDTHTTSMGIAYPGLIYVHPNALAGVYSYARNRQDIWNGLYERRTFATTGNERILVDFRVNGEQMGGEIASALSGGAPRIDMRVSGTAPLLRVELVKNNTVVYSVTPARGHGQLARIVWGDNLYQRRAAVGLRKGEVRSAGGPLKLIRAVNLDQAFEEVRPRGHDITWTTAAVSGDRDGFLADLSEVTGDLVFHLDDADTMGVFEVRIPIDQLRREGRFFWSAKGKERHPYMEKMGIEPRFFLECELVDPNGERDFRSTFAHQEPVKPGDYFYLRAEQLDTNKAWSSPVWVN